MPTQKRKARKTTGRTNRSRTVSKKAPERSPSGPVARAISPLDVMQALRIEPPKPVKRGRGRPHIELPKPFIVFLAKLGATYEEIAAVFTEAGRPVSTDTLKRNYADCIEGGRNSGKVSLRLAQWTSALAGKTDMQRWLGIQELGQREKSETKHTGGLGIADLLDDVPEAPLDADEDVPEVPLSRGNPKELPA